VFQAINVLARFRLCNLKLEGRIIFRTEDFRDNDGLDDDDLDLDGGDLHRVEVDDDDLDVGGFSNDVSASIVVL
jgi:hypothetical protein